MYLELCGSIAHVATIVGGVALIVGTIAEDVVTMGAGIADDAPSIAAGISLIAGSVPAVLTGAAIVTIEVTTGIAGKVTSAISSNMLPGDFYLPLYAIGPEQIFANKISILDVNFFNPNDYTTEKMLSGENMKEQKSIAETLQSTIAGWYVAIRNLCIVIMFLVLIYLGIKIIISSSSQDKAKYKERITDWLVGMCMLFFLHYFMGFVTTVNDMIVRALAGAEQTTYYYTIVDTDGKFRNYNFEMATEEDAGSAFNGTMADKLEGEGIIQDLDIDGKSYKSYVWPTNLMGRARIELQLEPQGNSEENNLIRKFGWTVIFIGMVMYTVLFLFRYIKRVIILAFLTMIAPFVAMTYPLDKVIDGKAQAFNIWIKEYMYNLLIQPVHYILFTMLISTCYEFASDNMIYALVAFGFMLQAEKIMRKLFGFDKASTIAGSSALGGALAMHGIHSISKLLGGGKGNKNAVGPGGKGQSQNNGTGDGENRRPRYRELTGMMDNLFGNREGTSQTTGNQTRPIPIGTRNGAGNQNRNNSGSARPEEETNNAMLDEEAKNFGTSDFDAQEYQNNLNATANDNTPYYSDEEYQQFLRDNGIEEENDDIRQKMLDEEYEDFGSPDYDYATEQNYQNELKDTDSSYYSDDEKETFDQLVNSGITEPWQLKEFGYSDEQISQWLNDKTMENGETPKQFRMANDDYNVTPQDIENDNIPQDNFGVQESEQTSEEQYRIRMSDESIYNAQQEIQEQPKRDIKGKVTKAAKYTLAGAAAATGGIGSLLLKTTLAGTGAMVGIAGGLVSDDFSNVAKMGAAGAASGWIAGKGVENKIKNVAGSVSKTVEDIKNENTAYHREKYGPKELKERQERIAEERAKLDKEARRKYAEELNLKRKEDIDRVMEQRAKYREKKIMDDKIIISAMKAEDFGDDRASDERILLAGMMNKVGGRAKEADKIKELNNFKEAFKSRNAEKESKKYTKAIADYFDLRRNI